MKYKKQIKFLISCMILLFTISCAQEKTNVEDLELRGIQYFTKDNQPFSGSVYRLYDNGNVKNQGTIKNGFGQGTFEQFYEDGELKMKGILKDWVWNIY